LAAEDAERRAEDAEKSREREGGAGTHVAAMNESALLRDLRAFLRALRGQAFDLRQALRLRA